MTTRRKISHKIKITIVIVLIVMVSCNSNTQYRYYSTGKLEEKRVFIEKKDTSTYLLTQYYPNEQMKIQGKVINSKREGVWNEWYADGSVLWSGEYNDGYRLQSKTIGYTKLLLSDSLAPNKPVLLRVYIEGIHRKDLRIGVTNGLIKLAEDNDLYDYVIVPEKSGIMKIYQAYLMHYEDYPEVETRIDTLYVYN